MAEEQDEVKVILVRMSCDECSGGYYQPLETEPGYKIPKGMDIPHVCDKCGNLQAFPKSYPYKDYIIPYRDIRSSPYDASVLRR